MAVKAILMLCCLLGMINLNISCLSNQHLNVLIKEFQNVKKELLKSDFYPDFKLRKSDVCVIINSERCLKEIYSNSEICFTLSTNATLVEYLKEILEIFRIVNITGISVNLNNEEIPDFKGKTQKLPKGMVWYFIIYTIPIFLSFMVCYFYGSCKSNEIVGTFDELQENQKKTANEMKKTMIENERECPKEIFTTQTKIISLTNTFQADRITLELDSSINKLQRKMDAAFEEFSVRKKKRIVEKRTERKDTSQRIELIEDRKIRMLAALQNLTELTDKLSEEVRDIDDVFNRLKEEGNKQEDRKDLSQIGSLLEELTARLCSVEMKIAQ